MAIKIHSSFSDCNEPFDVQIVTDGAVDIAVGVENQRGKCNTIIR